MLDKPLNDAELDELHSFLNSDSLPESTLSIEALDGFFCALAVNPELVMPSEWIPIVLGGDQTEVFENQDQAEHILGLIMRHWNSVNRTVRVKPTEGAAFFMPLLFPPEGEPADNDVETDYGEDWARGFVEGVRLQDHLWEEALKDEEVNDCLGGLLLLALGENPDDSEFVVDFALRRDIAGQLPFIAHHLWTYWHSDIQTKSSTKPFIAAPRTGRNDPCPCGSGKKYKKCCLN